MWLSATVAVSNIDIPIITPGITRGANAKKYSKPFKWNCSSSNSNAASVPISVSDAYHVLAINVAIALFLKLHRLVYKGYDRLFRVIRDSTH